MEIAILLFDGITALDAVGPYEVLAMMPDAHVRFVATERGAKRAARNGSLALVADHTLDEISHPDVVLVPGGPGEATIRQDPQVLSWLRRAHETSRWTTSVCTGSLTLAAAGFLDGVEATTHWSSMDELATLGAKPVPERVVVRGKVITQPACRQGSTWRCAWLSSRPGTTSPWPSSSSWSTTPSPRSTPALPPRPPPM